jgi:hypothetical protein
MLTNPGQNPIKFFSEFSQRLFSVIDPIFSSRVSWAKVFFKGGKKKMGPNPLSPPIMAVLFRV